jgi:NAD(P)H-dependent FMN reductase
MLDACRAVVPRRRDEGGLDVVNSALDACSQRLSELNARHAVALRLVGARYAKVICEGTLSVGRLLTHMPKHLIISTSGNSDSNSRIMGQVAFARLQKQTVDCDWIDISTLDLPLCDADKCYLNAAARDLKKAIEAADGMIIAAPVYNYDVSAAAKNMIELTGDAWEDKIVGFLCAAGGINSYMSVMAYANSLMLDFRTVIIPRFVYATGDAFEGDRLVDREVERRIQQVADDLIRFTKALRG